MKNIAALVTLILLFTANPAQALSMGGPGGWWPKSWPKELEPLRKQAWTWSHGRVHEGIAWGSYDIEFKTREQLEAAWPHILKLRDKDVPVTLRRGPHVRVWKTRPPKGQTSGVRIVFSTKVDKKQPPKIKLEKTTFSKTGGVFATQCTVRGIELVVDGKIVDLNRIHLPTGAKIIDQRFPERQGKYARARFTAWFRLMRGVLSRMRQLTTRERIERLMREMGRGVQSDGSIFFTGGATAVLLGWRETTMDVDLKADPEPTGFFECLPRLKEELDINIELAAPDQFVPALNDWRARSQLIERHGKVDFFHYDFYGQALAKIERGHPRDRLDVGEMIVGGLVAPEQLAELFAEVESELIKFPAIDAGSLSARVSAIAANGKWE